MKRASKGVIDVSTFDVIKIKKSAPFDEFNADVIKSDLDNAAETSNFIGSDGQIMNFNFIKESSLKSNNVEEKEFEFKMMNFTGVSFADSFKDAPIERQIMFKSWSKFWSHLSKLGYKIK